MAKVGVEPPKTAPKSHSKREDDHTRRHLTISLALARPQAQARIAQTKVNGPRQCALCECAEWAVRIDRACSRSPWTWGLVCLSLVSGKPACPEYSTSAEQMDGVRLVGLRLGDNVR